MNSGTFFIWTRIFISMDNKERPGDVLETKETIKDTYIIMKGKEIIKCKNLFTNLRVYKRQTNKYIILVKIKNINQKR